MNRLDYYFRQKVTEAELDQGFTYCETADKALVTDHGRIGIITGSTVAEQGVPDLTVQVAGGVVYDKSGQRINIPSTQNVDCSKDYNLVSTAVAAPGNERWLSIFAQTDRVLTDPRTDGNGLTVYFQRAESFKFKVVAGAEAGAGLGVRPALDGTNVLLADAKLVFGTTQIFNADISTTRRESSIVISGSPRAITQGQVNTALSNLLSYYNNHVTGAADKHPAADINYAGGPAWADGTTNPAATVEAQLDKIISDLGAGAGAAKIHANADGNFAGGFVSDFINQVAPFIGTLKVVNVYTVTDAGSHVTTAAAYETVGTMDISIASVANGDKLIVMANTHWFAAGGDTLKGRVCVVHPDASEHDLGNTEEVVTGALEFHATPVGIYTAVAAGTHHVRLQFFRSAGAGNPQSIGPIQLVVVWVKA